MKSVGLPLIDVVDTRRQQEGLERPALLVREVIAEVLDSARLGSGPIRETRIGDGHSNITYLIRRENFEGVLRRPPRPPFQAGAHDVVREARVQLALSGSSVPVPKILLVEPTGAALGVPFYIMENLVGHVLTSSIPTELNNLTGRYGLGVEFINGLIELHRIDIDAVGLRNLGQGEGFVERQLRTFGRLWETHRTRDLRSVDEAARWLAANRPRVSDITLIHGDYRIGNLMFAPGREARLLALLDWELATVGDPLTDLGYLLSTYPDPGETRGALLSLAGAVSDGGFPSRGDLVARYVAATSRDVTELNWYLVFAFYRTAVGLESFYRRSLAGTTDDTFIEGLRETVPELGERALAAIP